MIPPRSVCSQSASTVIGTADYIAAPTTAPQPSAPASRATPSGSKSDSSLPPGLVGGLAGGGAVFLVGYGWYRFSGAKSLVDTAHSTKSTLDKYTKQFKESTPEPNEALDWLRSTAQSYAKFIPGASGIVNSAFDDLDAVRNKHGKEVDQIVREAYDELREISKNGMSASSATKAWEALQRQLKRIGDLAGDAVFDIVDNHPRLKEKVGGNMDSLKEMGEKYGPEAKKQVEETWEEVREIAKNGISMDSVTKIQDLVQDKMEKLQALGGKVWEEGMERAKPLLEKAPEVKKIVEENEETLKKSGNVQQLYEKVKQAVDTGSSDDLKQYIQTSVDKLKQSSAGGGGLEGYLKMIPGGAEIIPNLSKMQQIAKEHGREAEQIATDTVKEIEGVLRKKLREAQELARKADENARKG